MMDYDDYLISTFGVDDGDERDADGHHPDEIPGHWHHITDTDSDDSESRQLDLNDWFDDRVSAMLGDDGAEHMDTRGLVAHWVLQGYVEARCGMWFFTREAEAKLWLPTK